MGFEKGSTERKMVIAALDQQNLWTQAMALVLNVSVTVSVSPEVVSEPELTARQKLYQSFGALDLSDQEYKHGRGLDLFLLDLADRNFGRRVRVADLVEIGLTQGFDRTYIYSRLHNMSNLTNKMRVRLSDRSFWGQAMGNGKKDWGFYTATKMVK